jgi:hypothetical protein
MLRSIALFLTLFMPFAFAGTPPDKDALVAKLRRDLDRAMAHGTPTDKEIDILKKSRADLTSTNKEEVQAAVDNIDHIAHTNSFKPQDASDVKKDIGNLRGHKSFLFLRLP